MAADAQVNVPLAPKGLPSVNLPQEVWAANMQAELKTKLVCDRILNMKYQDMATGAKTIRVAVVPRDTDPSQVAYDRSSATDNRGGTGSATVLAADGQPAVAADNPPFTVDRGDDDRQFTYPQLSAESYQIHVDESHKDSWRVENWDNLQTNVQFMSDFTMEKAYNFARIIEKWYLKDFADNVGIQPVANSSVFSNEQTDRTLGGANGVKILVADAYFDAIIQGIQKLDKDEVPREQQWAVVPYEITTALWKDTRFQRATETSDALNRGGDQRMFGSFEGIQIYRSALLPSPSANKVWTLMGYNDSYTSIVQDPLNFEIIPRLESYNAAGFRAAILWGGKMIRPNTCLRIRTDLTSTS